jgi:broad specificity phosphatase PhoE
MVASREPAVGTRFRWLRPALGAALGAVCALHARPAAAQDDAGLLAELRRGGLVLACRHALTDTTGPHPVSGDRRSQERNLSPEGEAQARRMGRTIGALRIPIGTVLSSRYYRTRETATLAFGQVEETDSLQQPTTLEAFQRLLGRAPRSGTNTVLVSHQAFIRRAAPESTHGTIGEGNCVVVRPGGGTRFEVLANLTAEGWERLGR